MKIFDIGANLIDDMFCGIYHGKQCHPPDVLSVLERAQNAGLEYIMITAGSVQETKQALELISQVQPFFNGILGTTLGFHPTRASSFDKESFFDFQVDSRIWALGELGLDFDRLSFCDKVVQEQVFRQQFHILEKFQLPLFLHMRNAFDSFYEIIRQYRHLFVHGVVHSFTGTQEEAAKLLALDLHIGINGCSLKTADNLKVVKSIPVDKLLVESDAPWCGLRSSHAHGIGYSDGKKKERWEKGCRIKERNEPDACLLVLKALSGLKEIPVHELSDIIFSNSIKIFFSRYRTYVCSNGAETSFRQQQLSAWRPVLTPYNVIPLFFAIGIIFAPLGILFLGTSLSVHEYTFDYTHCLTKASGSFQKQGGFEWRRVNGITCELRFKIKQEMKPPVMMYYRLTNYYQNQRMYVKSVDWRQLQGAAASRADLSACAPLAGPVDSSTLVYYPCGLIANSMFNDTIHPLKSASDDKFFEFEPKGIAWAADANRYGPTKYTIDQVRPPPFWSNLADPATGKYRALPKLYQDERFMVWMRVAGLPIFRKPYGKLNYSLPAGTYTVLINSVFEVVSFGGTKSLVISTTSWLGGRNLFLGIAYIIVGGLFLLMASVFLARHMWAPRRLGDINYLSWNQ